MSETLTLEQLAEMAGDEGIELGRGPGKDPFEIGTAYPVEITEQSVTTTKNGYFQLELALSIVKSDGELQRAGRVWEGLPVFSDEVKNSISLEKLAKVEKAFGQNLHRFLRVMDPAFNIYSRIDKTNDKKWVFFDNDGNPMSKAQKEARELHVGRAVKGAAKAIQAGTMMFTGRRMFLVKTRDAKDPKKVYVNYFSEQPEKYPLAG